MSDPQLMSPTGFFRCPSLLGKGAHFLSVAFAGCYYHTILDVKHKLFGAFKYYQYNLSALMFSSGHIWALPEGFRDWAYPRFDLRLLRLGGGNALLICTSGGVWD